MKKRTTFMAKISRTMAALLLLPALTLSFVACSDDDNAPDPNTITGLPNTIALAAGEAENTATLKFTALSAWEAAYANEDSKWFTFTPASGAVGDITITITAPYNDGATKTGTLTLKHGTNTYNVAVTQSAGQPDLPNWDEDNKKALLNTFFAPDPYNATDTTPTTFTLNVTTIQDYTTLEEAPFEVFTFYVDEEGTITDSVANWVKVTVAENSPAASQGKLLEMTVDTIDVNVDDFQGGDDRNTFICMVQKGTDKADMFTDGVMKDEYLEMGQFFTQRNYKVNYPFTQLMSMDTGTTPPETSATANIDANCKYKIFVMGDNQPTLKNWWNMELTGNTLTFGYDLNKVRTLTMGSQAMVNFVVQIDRGENLQPILFKAIPPLGINYMKLFI